MTVFLNLLDYFTHFWALIIKNDFFFGVLVFCIFTGIVVMVRKFMRGF